LAGSGGAAAKPSRSSPGLILWRLKSLMARLKTTCAADGTISNGRIEVQGDHRECVLAIPRELEYPA